MHVDIVVDPTDRSITEVVELARRAEDLGYGGVYTYDHLSGAVMGGSSIRHVWPTVTAVAMATSRVRVGPMVANATRHHPAELAVISATLQELTGGRFVLGVGAGAGPGSPYAAELAMVGLTPLPASTRRAVVEECVTTVRALWAGESVAGAHFAVTEPVGILRPGTVPPVVVGANGPRMAALAGRVADGVNLHAAEPDLAELVAVTRRAATEAGRREPSVVVEVPAVSEWLAGDGAGRTGAEQLGVDRLIVRWTAADGSEPPEPWA